MDEPRAMAGKLLYLRQKRRFVAATAPMASSRSIRRRAPHAAVAPDALPTRGPAAPFARLRGRAALALRTATDLAADELLVLSSGSCVGIVRTDELRRAEPGAAVGDCAMAPVLLVGPATTLAEARAHLGRVDRPRIVRRCRGGFSPMTRVELRCFIAELAMKHRHEKRPTAWTRRMISGVSARIDEGGAAGEELVSLYYADLGGQS